VKETDLATLQHLVSQFLIRHRSILDVQSKLNEATARISRALAYAVVTCGCVQIHAERQCFPATLGWETAVAFSPPTWRGNRASAVGSIWRARSAAPSSTWPPLCHISGLNLDAILRKERDRVSALGVYHLTYVPPEGWGTTSEETELRDHGFSDVVPQPYECTPLGRW